MPVVSPVTIAIPAPAANETTKTRIAVVIPCYCVKTKILDVLSRIPSDVAHIICVDDACPEKSADVIESKFHDERLELIRHATNLGVGGAVVSGYQRALALNADVIVKVDGDGQMDPTSISHFVTPIVTNQADYCKGNRFFLLRNLKSMPTSRLIGNAALSFFSKFSSGYWRVFDPTNGFTAIHRDVLKMIPLEKLHQRYFFESDMLYQLGLLRAVVQDIPQRAVYADEKSSLRVSSSIPLFLTLHCRNFLQRIFFNYFLRDFHLASIEWLLGPTLLLFGLIFGAMTWQENVASNVETPIGTVMLATLSVILGLQLTLSAIGFDIDNQPKIPIHSHLGEDDNSHDHFPT